MRYRRRSRFGYGRRRRSRRRRINRAVGRRGGLRL